MENYLKSTHLMAIKEYGVGQKRKVLDAIFNNILEKVNIKKEQMLIDIFNKNAIEQSYFSAVGHKFIYKGVMYTNPDNKRYRLQKENIQVVSLDENILDSMHSYLQTKNAIEDDSNAVGAYLTRVLNNCNNMYDIYVLLPEELHKYILPILDNTTATDIALNTTISPERATAFRKANANYEEIVLSINIKLLLLP